MFTCLSLFTLTVTRLHVEHVKNNNSPFLLHKYTSLFVLSINSHTYCTCTHTASYFLSGKEHYTGPAVLEFHSCVFGFLAVLRLESIYGCSLQPPVLSRKTSWTLYSITLRGYREKSKDRGYQERKTAGKFLKKMKLKSDKRRQRMRKCWKHKQKEADKRGFIL